MKVVELQRHVPLICTSPIGATNSINDWEEGETTNDNIYFYSLSWLVWRILCVDGHRQHLAGLIPDICPYAF